MTLVTLGTSNPITSLDPFSHSHQPPWWLVGMGIFPSAIVIFDVPNVTIREWSRLAACKRGGNDGIRIGQRKMRHCEGYGKI